MPNIERTITRRYLGMDGGVFDDQPFYLHPAGWEIRREVRDWDGRAYRGTMTGDPKVHWTVYDPDGHFVSATPTLYTLRDAKKWCDTHAVPPRRPRMRPRQRLRIEVT